MSTPQPPAVPTDPSAVEPSTGRRMLTMMDPRFLLALARGYPVGVKQFLWFSLLLIYPAWLFAILASAALYYAVYATLWVLFWPVRAWMKRNRPDDYAASQRK